MRRQTFLFLLLPAETSQHRSKVLSCQPPSSPLFAPLIGLRGSRQSEGETDATLVKNAMLVVLLHARSCFPYTQLAILLRKHLSSDIFISCVKFPESGHTTWPSVSYLPSDFDKRCVPGKRTWTKAHHHPHNDHIIKQTKKRRNATPSSRHRHTPREHFGTGKRKHEFPYYFATTAHGEGWDPSEPDPPKLQPPKLIHTCPNYG